MRANYKDVIETDQSELRVRFMKMTLPDAACEYDRCFPGFVGCSNIYLLRTRHVRIVSSDATCLCISHEKVLLVPTGSAISISHHHMFVCFSEAWYDTYKSSSNLNYICTVEVFTVSNCIVLMMWFVWAEGCCIGECSDWLAIDLIGIPILHTKGDIEEKYSWNLQER